MDEIETLVGGWLSVPELADAIGLPHRQVRKLIGDGTLLSHRVGEHRAVAVPAVFVKDGAILASVPGTVTVLRDAHLSEEEALRWLFAPRDGVAPMDMLLAGRKAEVRKRAQELAL